MAASFSDRAYLGCGKWIGERLDEDYSWEDIKSLCVEESLFDLTMEGFIEDELWPEELSKEKWIEYVEYYRKAHPAIQLSKTQKIIAIDKGGNNNSFEIPYGAASSWEQYRKYLSNSISEASIVNIERSCQWVLNHLKEETTRFGPVKGLVTGSVQSGKTANMTGLISMAADCGWNFFIILSGTIDNLRKQTRDRFKKDLKNSEGVFWKVLDFTGEDKKFGEGELKLNPLTKKSNPQRYVTVCLKNKRRLESLIEWLYEDETRAQKLRIVVIDDEADQASINTAEITTEEEQDRVAINQLIVNLVNGKKADGSTPRVQFQAMNYISYTATPYANVLNEPPGLSLYPKDFICTLPDSSEYFGPAVIFGNDEKDIPPLGIVRKIPKNENKSIQLMHKGLGNDIPDSMKLAVSWFLCVSAVVRVSPHENKKCLSMLIHTSAQQNPHFNEYDALKAWLRKHDEVLNCCSLIYETEKNKVTKEDLLASNPEYGLIDSVNEDMPEFNEIKCEIENILSSIQNILLDEDKSVSYGNGLHLCVDNCKANKEAEEGTTLRIVYPTEEQLGDLSKDPVFIVIGGNTLSRGLTIEGLVCTFFSRNSNQADTLMQMARWFGYRKGIELLQRIWMTDVVLEKYEALARIDADMKVEIERFMERGVSPEDFGPRIRNIPEIKSFRITSKNKSQKAEYDDFDFKGDSYETTDFDEDYLYANIKATEDFLLELSEKRFPYKSHTRNAYVWPMVKYSAIKDFLTERYKISEFSCLYTNLPVFLQWIEQMQEGKKYTRWNVVVVDGDNKDREWNIIDDITVGLIERTKKDNKEHIDIGALRSGLDALADVDTDKLDVEQQKILTDTIKSRKDIIARRSDLLLDDVPLLIIYRIKNDGGVEKKGRVKINSKEDIIGISIVVSGESIGGNHAKTLRIKIKEDSEVYQ